MMSIAPLKKADLVPGLRRKTTPPPPALAYSAPVTTQEAGAATYQDKPNLRDAALPKVAILLCAFEGQRYLAEQLDSFTTQSHYNWEVWASDDGSRDGTPAILERYQSKWGNAKLSVQHGPQKGFVANFLSLVCNPKVVADYYAYSDQDDIWDADKLEQAVAWLQTIPTNIPALYCARTRLVDARNNDVGFSPLFSKRPSFANALMQNIAGGNTMVFNNAARTLIQAAGSEVDIVAHDWWTYLVVSGCGGQIYYDAQPSLRYRQHDSNLIGRDSTWSARLVRFRMLWRGRHRDWNTRNIRALNQIRPQLTEDSRKTLDYFAEARDKNSLLRLLGFIRAGVYRQTPLANVGLIAAVIFKKM